MGDPLATPLRAVCALCLAWGGIVCALRSARSAGAPWLAATCILAVAAIARLLVLTWDPGLSDDIFRYIWDGRVLLSGRNPYDAAPLDPALAPLHDANWSRINHPELATIYPPVAEGFAAAVVAIGGASRTSFAAAVILLDLALCGVLAVALARRGLSPAWAALYAWNPLAIVEVGASGHIDTVAILPLVGCVALLRAKSPRRATAGALLGLSVLGKYGAILLVPLLARRLGARGLAIAAFIVVAGLAPFVLTAPHVFTSLGVYLRTWEFNGSAYAILTHITRDPLLSRRILAVVTLVIVGWIALRDGTRAPRLAIAAALSFFVVLVFSHTVHPWYMLWPLAFAALAVPERNGTTWCVAIAVWSATVFAAYAVLVGYRASGRWALPVWASVAEYVPVALVLVVAVARRRSPA